MYTSTATLDAGLHTIVTSIYTKHKACNIYAFDLLAIFVICMHAYTYVYISLSKLLVKLLKDYLFFHAGSHKYSGLYV